MHLKDYYGILEIEASSNKTEIKKAYRKLAHQYHPDKNQNDPYASAHFAEIKEAYEVLTNPAKKEYYLQQRWYDQSIGKRKKQDVITPVSVLKQSLELERYVSALDVFRMDKQGLQQYILELVTDSTIQQLSSFNEPDVIRQIINTILKAMKPLPQNYTTPVLVRLKKLSRTDNITREELAHFKNKLAKKSRQDKYSLIIIILVTIFLCLLIFLAGR